MQHLIEVPHWAQYYDIEDDFWQGRSCGIVSLAMVLDHYGVKFELNSLIEEGLRLGGYKEGVGWTHPAICQLARSFSLISFRRLWMLAERDREFFSSEGNGEREIKEYNQCLLNEGLLGLKLEIDQDQPVIISIYKNWDHKNGGHLAVLNGYLETDGELAGFYVNDPIGAAYKHKNQFIPLDKFIRGWKRRAIYVKKG